MVHQCTKSLLTARRYRLYLGLIDPITDEAVELDDEAVQALCQSNIALLDEMAKIAPVVAVLQQDVKKMVEVDKDRRQNDAETQEHAPVSSEVQRSNLLSRYHPLSQSFDSNAETADEVALQHSDPPQPSTYQMLAMSPPDTRMVDSTGDKISDTTGPAEPPTRSRLQGTFILYLWQALLDCMTSAQVLTDPSHGLGLQKTNLPLDTLWHLHNLT
ncbi:zinc finger transcription factor 1 [Colletotrichum tofieldiae]|nr:zinc finger transcription factor 1 [Colletotrichum tofieldiae]